MNQIKDNWNSIIWEKLKELVEEKSPDLVEAYKHLGIAQRKRYYWFLCHLVEDALKYSNKKKATRKISKPRVKTAGKQIAKVKYKAPRPPAKTSGQAS